MTQKPGSDTQLSEIIEGNKIIAEFMGWRFDVHANLVTAFFNDRQQWLDDKEFLDDLLKSEHGFCFNSSWDKLMPVVEKIDKLEDSEGKEAFQGLVRYHAPYAHREEIWKAVVKFIKWYNQHPAS